MIELHQVLVLQVRPGSFPQLVAVIERGVCWVKIMSKVRLGRQVKWISLLRFFTDASVVAVPMQDVTVVEELEVEHRDGLLVLLRWHDVDAPVEHCFCDI